ncbi:hypothetical protein T484DRAFT_1746263 [Baffinella frigidus]|nr:hypothetical protein T484DRAFT_1746263 [Cryptophyta sp. CCMP2293]
MRTPLRPWRLGRTPHQAKRLGSQRTVQTQPSPLKPTPGPQPSPLKPTPGPQPSPLKPTPGPQPSPLKPTPELQARGQLQDGSQLRKTPHVVTSPHRNAGKRLHAKKPLRRSCKLSTKQRAS